jgi:hypothetical protein
MSEGAGAATLLSGQRQLLRNLAVLEKSQDEDTLVCDSIVFENEGTAVISLRTASVRVPLTASSEAIFACSSATWTGKLLPPSDHALDAVNLRPSVAATWAEVHFDLARTSYLDELDSSIRFTSIVLDGGEAALSVSSRQRRGGAVVRVDLRRSRELIHLADEVAEALT